MLSIPAVHRPVLAASADRGGRRAVVAALRISIGFFIPSCFLRQAPSWLSSIFLFWKNRRLCHATATSIIIIGIAAAPSSLLSFLVVGNAKPPGRCRSSMASESLATQEATLRMLFSKKKASSIEWRRQLDPSLHPANKWARRLSVDNHHGGRRIHSARHKMT